MGAGVARAASNSGRRSRRRSAVMSDINVTPFVDVMLVLLIVFMVSAPLLTVAQLFRLVDHRQAFEGQCDAHPIGGGAAKVGIELHRQ